MNTPEGKFCFLKNINMNDTTFKSNDISLIFILNFIFEEQFFLNISHIKYFYFYSLYFYWKCSKDFKFLLLKYFLKWDELFPRIHKLKTEKLFR